MSANRTELVGLTRRLVSIPSHEDETAAGDAVEAWLREETDAAVRRDAHGNVFARRGADGRGGESADGRGGESADGRSGESVDGREDENGADGRSGDSPDGARGTASLALVGHHDVVPPDESQVERAAPGDAETAERYVVEERDGRLYGRGTADMKGPLAAAMLAFRDADPTGELVFASFVGEERGGIGAQAAIEDGFAPDYAVVGEGSTNYAGDDQTDVVVAHRGRRGSTITARGTAAHASEPESGENAIYRACDAVDVVRDLDAPETTVLDERVRGSVAVTEIEGGSAWNVVPESCTATVDERTVPGERAPLERVESIDGVSWSVDQDLPPMACDDAAFADAALAAADAAQAATPERVTKPHATDAGWLAAAGTSCVVIGASEPGEAHTADESVSIEVLERCRRIYRTLAERWPPE